MDAYENPFGLQEPLKRKLLKELKKIELNRYPEAGNGIDSSGIFYWQSWVCQAAL